LTADPLALLLMRGEDLAGETTEMLLHVTGLQEQLAVVLQALLEGCFEGLAPNEFTLQLALGLGQLDGPSVHRPIEPIQMAVLHHRRAMRVFERSQRLDEERRRSSDLAVVGPG